MLRNHVYSDRSVHGVTDLNVAAEVCADGDLFRIVVTPPIAVILWLAPQPTMEFSQAAFDRLLRHPSFRPRFGVVSDWRRATANAGAHFGVDFLDALGRLQANGALQGRWATVVPASAQMVCLYGVGRKIEILGRTSGLQYEVFVNYDEAVAWAAARAQGRVRSAADRTIERPRTR